MTARNSKNQRFTTKVNQSLKLKQRRLIFWGVSCFIITAGTLLFFHLFSTNSGKAKSNELPHYVAMEDQIYTTEMSTAEPFIRTALPLSPNTIYTKKMIADTLDQ